jgi:putative hemolysin
MEDALEELVGEIYDEYDKDEDYPEVIDLGNNYYEIMPQTTIEDLYEYLDLTDMPEDSYGTIAGFVYELCEGLPEEGRKISVESVKTRFEGEKLVEDVYRLTYEILSVENRRIRKLKLLLEKVEEQDKVESKDTKEEIED